ncbi:MAG: hypothetical protein HWN80_17900 [Candidatus Lokiarchaeota archaeon]|nr:hypothetical protein [Candidatus Lokiarchaeota archaeon]
MRLNAIRTSSYAYYLGIIQSDEVTVLKPMQFLVDTGSVCTVISAFYLENNFDCSRLQRGTDSMGVGGIEKTYLVHNAHLLLFTDDHKWHYIHKFDEMQVIPRTYAKGTKKVIPIPCLLGTDLIGKKYKLVYGKKEIFLQD